MDQGTYLKQKKKPIFNFAVEFLFTEQNSENNKKLKLKVENVQVQIVHFFLYFRQILLYLS